MSLSINPILATASCNTHVDAIDLGTGEAAGYFVVFSGPIPAEYSEAVDPSSVELVKMVMANPAFGAATDDPDNLLVTATANAVTDTPADADGTATFYRQYDRDGTVLWQGTVTAPNLGGDMEISNTAVVAAVEVVLISYAFSIPYGMSV